MVLWHGLGGSWDYGILGLEMRIWEIEEKMRQDTLWRLNENLEIAHLENEK